MSDNGNILACERVSIRYMVGDFKAIGLKEWVVRRLTGNYKVKEFWADRDITFSLDKGDMLGIIGTNGAGKSTLLKAISGIMEPTRGYVTRRGKIAALLELASGFDGDLTVKENAYLRGAMLGYTRAFMDETYERIIDFAELKEFEHRPFKQLSSGMKSRLAFSIASLVQPDILILDEVLSVGDGAFRVKSEAKMNEIIKGGATTILVTHSIAQVRAMCNKILWLNHGCQVCFSTDVKATCDAYERYLISGDLYEATTFLESPAKAPGESIWDKAADIYRQRMGRPLDYVHPLDLSQKLMWLTRYWQHPLKSTCADKYKVREYVKEKGLGHLLVPLMAVYRHPEEIPFTELPNQFVLKCNHGCGYNIICTDKGNFDIERAKAKLGKWLQQDYSLLAREAHYHSIRPMIVCETLIQTEAPVECQFWCVNGKPESILACRKNYDGSYDAWSYGLDWTRLNDRIGETSDGGIPRPAHLEEMTAAAERLSQPFPFVRVDFYLSGKRIYFAELTFTPAANMLNKYKQSFLDRLGAMLVLPHKYI